VEKGNSLQRISSPRISRRPHATPCSDAEGATDATRATPIVPSTALARRQLHPLQSAERLELHDSAHAATR
jgi:hypothetical protein